MIKIICEDEESLRECKKVLDKLPNKYQLQGYIEEFQRKELKIYYRIDIRSTNDKFVKLPCDFKIKRIEFEDSRFNLEGTLIIDDQEYNIIIDVPHVTVVY